MMSDDRRPDWNYWKNVPYWTILEAVALSMHIDPNKLRHRKPPGTMGVVDVRDESPEFEKRLSLALRNLTTLSAGGIGDADEPELCRVKQAKFSAVALSWGWKIPSEMAALASSENGLAAKEAMPSKKWPWGSRETKLLGELAQAAKELWSRYDPTDTTTAPTNIQVRDFLMKRNVSKRVAEVMAQILRADELPKGNHKR